jgi:hypothetical protein
MIALFAKSWVCQNGEYKNEYTTKVVQLNQKNGKTKDLNMLSIFNMI